MKYWWSIRTTKGREIWVKGNAETFDTKLVYDSISEDEELASWQRKDAIVYGSRWWWTVTTSTGRTLRVKGSWRFYGEAKDTAEKLLRGNETIVAWKCNEPVLYG